MNSSMISYEGLTEKDVEWPELPQPFLPGSRNRNPLFYLGFSLLEDNEAETKKSSSKNMPVNLQDYSKKFNTYELTASFEELLSEDKIRKLYKTVSGTALTYCPWFYKGITHVGKIDSPKLGLSIDFLNRVQQLKDKLGCCLLQLPESCRAENADGLLRYLQALPENVDIAVELTNQDWYTNPERFALVVEKMHQLHKSLVITDSPGWRERLHMQLSSPTAYIRFYARGWNEIDLHRISLWKKQLQSWYLQGLEKCYFFLFVQHEEGLEDFISYVQEELRF